MANDKVAVHNDKEQLNGPNVSETSQHSNDGDETAMMEDFKEVADCERDKI